MIPVYLTMKKMLGLTGLLSAALLIPSVGGFAADDHKFGPEAARDGLKEFTVADGLEVSLFASEPMVVNPANMDIDARGRAWVTEGANYRVSKRMHPCASCTETQPSMKPGRASTPTGLSRISPRAPTGRAARPAAARRSR